ncbi:MAG: hypothetical protein LBR06_08495 [Bacteroidales bacterium]|jgi:hypothetical protein|nr:hypothetical protein [Bacteroidales bacterium]
MRKINFFVVLLAAAMVSACGSKQKLSDGEVEIITPCSGPEFMTDGEYFRASAVGSSTDQTIAKKKAQTTARTEIATAISSKVKAVTDDYLSSYSVGENDESKRRFQELSRTVVDQQLNGVRTICEKTTKTKEGLYKVYTALELGGDEIANAMANRIKNDDKLRIDFEYEKFKKVFDSEMQKLADEK